MPKPSVYFTRREVPKAQQMSSEPFLPIHRGLFAPLSTTIIQCGVGRTLARYPQDCPFPHWGSFPLITQCVSAVAGINAGLRVDVPITMTNFARDIRALSAEHTEHALAHYASLQQAHRARTLRDLLGPDEACEPPFRQEIIRLTEQCLDAAQRAEALAKEWETNKQPIIPERSDVELMAEVVITFMMTQALEKPKSSDTTAGRNSVAAMFSGPPSMYATLVSYSLTRRGDAFPEPLEDTAIVRFNSKGEAYVKKESQIQS